LLGTIAVDILIGELSAESGGERSQLPTPGSFPDDDAAARAFVMEATGVFACSRTA